MWRTIYEADQTLSRDELWRICIDRKIGWPIPVIKSDWTPRQAAAAQRVGLLPPSAACAWTRGLAVIGDALSAWLPDLDMTGYPGLRAVFQRNPLRVLSIWMDKDAALANSRPVPPDAFIGPLVTLPVYRESVVRPCCVAGMLRRLR